MARRSWSKRPRRNEVFPLDKTRFLSFAVLVLFFLAAFSFQFLLGESSRDPGNLENESNQGNLVSFSALTLRNLLDFFAKVPVLDSFFSFFYPLTSFQSPTYFFLPFLGFWAAYWIIPWGSLFFRTSFLKSFWFPLALIVFGLVAYYVATNFYYLNVFLSVWNQGGKAGICWCDTSCTDAGLDYAVNFCQQVRNSTFFQFILGGLFGWLGFHVRQAAREFLEKQEPAPASPAKEPA